MIKVSAKIKIVIKIHQWFGKMIKIPVIAAMIPVAKISEIKSPLSWS